MCFCGFRFLGFSKVVIYEIIILVFSVLCIIFYVKIIKIIRFMNYVGFVSCKRLVVICFFIF